MSQHDEYYAEDRFTGLQSTGRVYTGPFLGIGFGSILGCFVMSSITKKSPNLSFRWLQRRVGAQFMTIAYFFTTNILYFHDGRHWRTRDIDGLAADMPTTGKVTPKAGITLLSKQGDSLQFAHSASASGEFNVKQKLGKKLTLGVGFTDNHVRNTVVPARWRNVRTIPGLVVSGDLQARSDLKLSVSHNVSATATKLGFTYDTKINNKKTQLKVNYLTKGKAVTGELISSLAANKKATVAFTDKQVTNVKIALTDDKFTYEPSYNLVKKAPSLAISRPLHGGKYKFGWNLKTDDLSLEYSYKALKFVAFKSPKDTIPRIGASFEHDWEL
eukprot:gene4888-5133_t